MTESRLTVILFALIGIVLLVAAVMWRVKVLRWLVMGVALGAGLAVL